MTEVYRDWAVVLVDDEPTKHEVLLAGRSADEVEIAAKVSFGPCPGGSGHHGGPLGASLRRCAWASLPREHPHEVD